MLTRLSFRRAILCIVAALLVAVAMQTPARAALPYAATPGAVFNNPTSADRVQRNAIMRQRQAQIDHTPRGATIRMAIFSINVPTFTKKLIGAYKRGVHEVILMDDHGAKGNPQWAALTKALGTDTRARSYAITCHTSCMSPHTGAYMHAKFYEFSQTGSSRWVVTVSSANPTLAQERSGWNNAYTMVNDATSYNAYKQYFKDMLAGARGVVQRDYYHTVISGPVKSYFMPHAGKSNSSDMIYVTLQHISCSGAATGYGAGGHTVIRVAMFEWTTKRLALAQKLWALDNAGCSVQVVYTPGVTTPQVLAALRKKGGKYGGIKVMNGSKDLNHNGSPDLFVHSKYMAVNGVYGGNPRSKFVITGSQNWSGNGLRYDNEETVRIANDATCDLFMKNFAHLRAYALQPGATANIVTGTDAND